MSSDDSKLLPDPWFVQPSFAMGHPLGGLPRPVSWLAFVAFLPLMYGLTFAMLHAIPFVIHHVTHPAPESENQGVLIVTFLFLLATFSTLLGFPLFVLSNVLLFDAARYFQAHIFRKPLDNPEYLGQRGAALKEQPCRRVGRVKSRLSVQHTQKSFSIIAEVSPRPVPITRNRSARSAAGNLATSSMSRYLRVIPGDLPHCVCDPVGRITGPATARLGSWRRGPCGFG